MQFDWTKCNSIILYHIKLYDMAKNKARLTIALWSPRVTVYINTDIGDFFLATTRRTEYYVTCAGHRHASTWWYRTIIRPLCTIFTSFYFLKSFNFIVYLTSRINILHAFLVSEKMLFQKRKRNSQCPGNNARVSR